MNPEHSANSPNFTHTHSEGEVVAEGEHLYKVENATYVQKVNSFLQGF
jgi:hypothetical protein